MIKKHGIFVVIGVFLILALSLWFMYPHENRGDKIPVLDRFDDKIVYTTDLSVSEEGLRAHCKAEGGLFNLCGSPCPTHETMCAQVCAYTCEEL